MALSQKFKTNEANAAIDHALLLNPNSSKDNVWKGIVLGMESKNDDIQGYLDKGLMLDPNNLCGWNAKGIIEEDKGDKAAAIFDYKKAIKLYPDDTTALKGLYRLEHPS